MTSYKEHNILCKELIEQEAKDMCKNALLFVLVVVGLVWLTGCSASVTPKVIDKANALCENNGKLYSLLADNLSGSARVYCKNGAQFYIGSEDVK